MLVATPGQTTAYALHNNNNCGSGNSTTTTASIPTVTSSANTPASSVSSTIVTTKKQQAVLNKLSSSKETQKCIINNNNNIATSTAKSINKTVNSTSATLQNNFNFHAPPNKRDDNSIGKNSLIANHLQQQQQQQHSLNNSNCTKPSRSASFLSTLKDTVQKALVTTASSLTKNGGNRTTANTTLNTSNTTSNNTSSTSLHVRSSASSSSALSLSATTKNSSATIITTVASATASSSSLSAATYTILPLTIARKKFTQSISTHPKLHTIPPTTLHRCAKERQKTSSTDSLEKEMCHFKPIRTVPTTPWKSGSKSRGSSLRFPKANLATTKTEFILKSNCDVNNRKRKQQTKLRQIDQDIVINETGQNSDNNDEQENKVYREVYKPKPSSLHLCASFLKQNHQSAFVCLVANLMNIQSSDSFDSSSSSSASISIDNMAQQNPKIRRPLGRPRKVVPTATVTQSTDKSVKEIFVRNKKFKSPLPPPHLSAKRARLSTASIRSQPISRKTQTPSRKSLKGAKINESNVAKLAKTGKGISRKRKSTTGGAELQKSTQTPVITSPFFFPLTSSSRSSSALMRRSALLTAETMSSNIYIKYPELNKEQRNSMGFSPPLTRSRLKRFLSERQLQTSKPGIKKRKG